MCRAIVTYISLFFFSCVVFAERVSNIELQLDQHTELPLIYPTKPMLQQWMQQLKNKQSSSSWYRTKSLLLFQEGMTNPKGEAELAQLNVLVANTDSLALEAQAEVYSALAELNLYHQNYTNALNLIEPMQVILAKLKHSRLEFQFNHQIGRILKVNGQFKQALPYFLSAHRGVMALTDERTEFRRQYLQMLMARIQARLQNYRYSRSISSEALEIAYHNDFKELLPELHLVHGAAIQMLEGPTDQVLSEYDKASHAVDDRARGRTQMLALNNIGSVYLFRANYEKALDYLGQGMKIAKRLQNDREIHVMNFNAGYIQVLQKQQLRGLELMEQAYEIYKAKTTLATQAIMLGHLADAFNSVGLHEKENTALREYRKIKDEVLAVERDRVYSELQVQFDAQEQALKIKLLEQESRLRDERLASAKKENLWFSGLIVLLLFGLVSTLLGISRARRLNTRLDEISKRDPLTKLYNRRVLVDLKQQVGDLVLLLDVDHFKQINDEYGHDIGDVVLTELAKRLLENVRKEDWVLRWGGEEFLLVLREVEAGFVVARIQKVLSSIREHTIAGLDVSVSGGAVLLHDREAMKQVLKQADTLLYQAKKSGRKRVLYQAEQEGEALEII